MENIEIKYKALCERFATHIDAYINEKHLTNQQFGQMVDKSEASVRNWRKAELLPDLKTILKICEILKIEYYILLGSDLDQAFEIYHAYLEHQEHQSSVKALLGLK